MATISIEASPIPLPGFLHLYLVYTSDAGQEFVIRGGPENSVPPYFGPMALEVNVPIENSRILSK